MMMIVVVVFIAIIIVVIIIISIKKTIVVLYVTITSFCRGDDIYFNHIMPEMVVNNYKGVCRLCLYLLHSTDYFRSPMNHLLGSAKDVLGCLRQGSVSAVELVEAALRQQENVARLNAFISRTSETALKAADESQKRYD